MDFKEQTFKKQRRRESSTFTHCSLRWTEIYEGGQRKGEITTRPASHSPDTQPYRDGTWAAANVTVEFS
jgi:hypothetical protein